VIGDELVNTSLTETCTVFVVKSTRALKIERAEKLHYMIIE